MSRKINLVNTVMVIYFFLVSFVLLNIIQVTYEQNQVDKLNSDFLSSKSISFKINSKKAVYAEDIIDFLNNSKANNFVVQYHTDSNESIFYYSKGFADKPPMVEGSFFSNEDYYSSPSTVLGKSLKNSSQDNVKGIMGYEIESNLDMASFISFSKKAEKHKIDDWSYFSIDGFGMNKAYSLLRESDFGNDIKEITKKDKTLSTLGMVLVQPILLYPIILLIFMSTSLIIIDEYCYYRKKEYRVKKLIGVSNLTLIRELLFELMGLAAIGIFVGNILSYLFFVNMSPVLILAIALIEIIITGIVNLYYSYKMTKVSGVWRNE